MAFTSRSTSSRHVDPHRFPAIAARLPGKRWWTSVLTEVFGLKQLTGKYSHQARRAKSSSRARVECRQALERRERDRQPPATAIRIRPSPVEIDPIGFEGR